MHRAGERKGGTSGAVYVSKIQGLAAIIIHINNATMFRAIQSAAAAIIRELAVAAIAYHPRRATDKRDAVNRKFAKRPKLLIVARARACSVL